MKIFDINPYSPHYIKHLNVLAISGPNLVGIFVGEGILATKLFERTSHIHLNEWPCWLCGEKIDLLFGFLGGLRLVCSRIDGRFFIHLQYACLVWVLHDA